MTHNEALKLLNLTENYTDDELKTVYRKAAMRTHPDRNNGSTEAFARVTSAYSFLSNKVCSVCGGSGRTTVYDGPMKTEINCPECWSK